MHFLCHPLRSTNLHKITLISSPGPLERAPEGNLCGLEPQLIKLEFIIYLPKLKVSVPLIVLICPLKGGFGAYFGVIWP